MNTAFLVKDNLEIEETSFLDVWIKYLNKENEYVEYCCSEGGDCEYFYPSEGYYCDESYDIESCFEKHKLNVYLMNHEGFRVKRLAEEVSYAEAVYEEYSFYEWRAWFYQKIKSHGIIQIFFSLEEAEKFVEIQKKEKEEKIS